MLKAFNLKKAHLVDNLVLCLVYHSILIAAEKIDRGKEGMKIGVENDKGDLDSPVTQEGIALGNCGRTRNIDKRKAK